MREIGILIIDFSFPEEETSRAQHLSLALYSSSKAESNLGWRYPRYVKVLWQVWSSPFPSITGFWRCSLWKANLSRHSSPTRCSSRRSSLTPHTRSSSRPWSSGPRGTAMTWRSASRSGPAATRFARFRGRTPACTSPRTWCRTVRMIVASAWSASPLVAELVKLEKTTELMSSCLSRTFRKEKLVIIYWKSIITENLCHKSMK